MKDCIVKIPQNKLFVLFLFETFIHHFGMDYNTDARLNNAMSVSVTAITIVFMAQFSFFAPVNLSLFINF